MASSALQSCTSTNDIDGMNRSEALEIGESLFVSLLEESQDEGRSDERLYSIIQSLEAEINHTTLGDVHDYDYDIDIEMLSNDGSNSNGQMYHAEDGHGWHLNNFVLESSDLELVPCPIGEDMDFYIDTHGDEMTDFTEFENLSDYLSVCNEVHIEGQVCSSLWQQ